MRSTTNTGIFVKKSLSALTSSSKEEVSVTWRIENYLAEAAVAASKGKRILGVSFFVGGDENVGDVEQESATFLGIPRVPLVCNLDHDVRSRKVNLTLSLEKPGEVEMNEGSAAVSKPSFELWTLFEAKIVKDSLRLASAGNKEPKKLSSGGWGSQSFFVNDVERYLDAKGSLTVCLNVTTYAILNETVTGAIEVDDVAELDGKFREGVLIGVESLLGDKRTSDIRISVVDEEKELGSFFCHKAILSARSPVFYAMFDEDWMVENREGVLKVEDVSVGVMNQFLTFLYSGRLKGKSEGSNFEPVWVKMLPQLVLVAEKFGVGDLKEFCDVHLHRAVKADNALDIYMFAKRHGLSKTVAKLRNDFVHLVNIDTIDVLLKSMST